jgi:beta-N-acetylhexosaminidase
MLGSFLRGIPLVLILLFGTTGGSGCASPPADPPPAAPAEPDPEPRESHAPGDTAVAVPDRDAVQPGDRVPIDWIEEEVSGRERAGDVSPSAPLIDPPPWTSSEPGAWSEATLASMSLRQKVGQMIMPWVMGDFSPEGSQGFDRITRLIDEQEIGGVIISVGTPMDVAAKLNALQRRSSLPLLVAADLETGAGFRMRGAIHLPGVHDLGGATTFPSLMALGAADDSALAYEMGRITALEARAVGVHVPFAPVLDVNSNPDNPIINTRSFGEDPERVGELGVCFIRGMQEHGALATGKHFPGHGDTETDSHLALPVINSDRARLDRIELSPFRTAVEAGMGAIMTAHIAIPELTGDARLPATLSNRVLTQLLRDSWGFQGIVFTDAMDMNAIDRLYGRDEAVVRAVEAGADVILMPPAPDRAIRAVVDAVLSGRIDEERIDASVRRILATKEQMGLHRERTVSLDEVHRRVGIPAHTRVAREAAERSLTLLKNEGGILPLRGTRSADVVSVTYRRQNDLMGGRAFNARLRQTYPGLDTHSVGRETRSEEYARLLARARRADLVVVSLHVAAVSYAGSVAIPEEAADFVTSLAREGISHVVVSFGNPYLLREFPDARSYLLAWGGSDESQRAAAGALFGEVPIRGRTPTRIPPGFGIGEGIRLGGGLAAASSFGGSTVCGS